MIVGVVVVMMVLKSKLIVVENVGVRVGGRGGPTTEVVVDVVVVHVVLCLM